jgi:hypothetical protein
MVVLAVIKIPQTNEDAGHKQYSKEAREDSQSDLQNDDCKDNCNNTNDKKIHDSNFFLSRMFNILALTLAVNLLSGLPQRQMQIPPPHTSKPVGLSRMNSQL